jgi:hypothetical protein
MTGKEIAARIHGTVLSILLALKHNLVMTSVHAQLGCTYRAISIAPADHGFVNSSDGFGAAGLPGCRADGCGVSREGESNGEEKERRYSAMKKSSFRAQNVKRTVCYPC